MNQSFAPLLVSVYNRKSHFQALISSLQVNKESKITDLFIVSDFAYKPEHVSIITEIREYCKSIEGFKSISLIFRDKNFGSYLSINNAIDYVFNYHNKLIFLEDDNIVSENFLRYMNDCLTFYSDDESLFSICGYNFPIKIPKTYPHSIYKWQGYSAWGVGLWKHKWGIINWDLNWVHEYLSISENRRKIINIYPHLVSQFEQDLLNKKITADTFINIVMIKENLFSIFPVLSKVKNSGKDGTGEHGGKNFTFLLQNIDNNSNYKLIKNIKDDKSINKVLIKYCKVPLKQRISILIKDTIGVKNHSLIKKLLVRNAR